MATSSLPASRALAERMIEYINASPTAFHCVEVTRKRLEAAGYARLDERNSWKGVVEPGKKFYFTRNGSCLMAFAVGGKYAPGNGCKIVAAHTDSPNLRVKPNSDAKGNGYQQLSVSTYGGGLWHTWFDRDLTVAGRVVVKTADGKLDSKVIDVKRPVARVPNLCIHLQTQDQREAFKVNKEKHITPILCTALVEQLTESKVEEGDREGMMKIHYPALLKVIAKEAGVEPEAVVDFDLSLADVQPAQIGGLMEEFVHAPRLDNQCSCFAALEAIVEEEGNLGEEEQVRVAAFYDNEEVGSASRQGAGSDHILTMIRRLNTALGEGEVSDISLSRSFMLSADMAHAIHPCYSDRHHPLHQPEIQKGVVMKYHCNQRYATTDGTAAPVYRLASSHGVPMQRFTTANDTPCGSTIGPIMSTRTGIRTVDIGAPQLSMHSIRETMGVLDVTHYVNLMKVFYREFEDFAALD